MTPEALDALVAAGATAEMIVAAVKADMVADETRKVERRAKDAERQRKSRTNRRGHGKSRGVTVTECDPLNEYISKPVPSETKVSSGSEKRARGQKSQIEIPDWIPRESWDGWQAMRRGKGAKTEGRAITLAIGELEKLRRDGHDPGAVLDQSTLKNWTGLFPLKDAQNGRLPATGTFRPEPAMDLKRRAEAELAAESLSGYQEPGGGTRLALPDYLTN